MTEIHSCEQLRRILEEFTFESGNYTWNEKILRIDNWAGIFNIRRIDEVLFMLTHCLNELRV